MTPMQRPGMPPQRPGMPQQQAGMRPQRPGTSGFGAQGSMPFQSPSTPPPTGANGIAGAFQGINPARAGYDVGNAAIMANQQQAQPQKQVTAADIQKRMQDIYSSPTGQAMTLRNTYLNNPGLVNPNIPQTDYAAMGFSPEAAAARQAFDKQQQQMGVDFRTQLMNTNSSTKAAELMQQYTTNLGNADQQFLQQNPAFAQQAQENMMRSGQFNQAQQDSMRQQLQQQNLGMQGGLNAQQANLHAMDAAGRAQLQNLGMQGGMPGQLGGTQLQNLGMQGGMQQSLGGQGGMQQAGMGQANLGGAAGALQQSVNAARAIPPVPGMSAPPGQRVGMFGGGAPMPGSNLPSFQQVGMFGGGAPMPQQQAPAGANFGVGPFGPGMGVQGGMGAQQQQADPMGNMVGGMLGGFAGIR